jgi:hypothetical protein
VRDPQFWTAVGTLALAGATQLAVLVAVFQDLIRSWVVHPTLCVTISGQPPDCHKTGILTQLPDGNLQFGECYYIRLRIKNEGKKRAELAEVLVTELQKQDASGKFCPITAFAPMRLMWSYARTPELPGISPDTLRHCDVAHIIQPGVRKKFRGEDPFAPEFAKDNEAILSLDLEARSLTGNYLHPPGTYRLVLVVSAANAASVRKTLEIKLTGTWYTHEQKMLQDGIGTRLL